MANIYDNIINRTFADPAMQTSGWGKPVGNASPQYLRQGASGVSFNPGEGFVPGAMPTDRLPQGTAGLPNPSPGSGLTPQQVSALGGWNVDPLTGQLAYAKPGATNPAVAAAAGQAAGYPAVQDYGQSAPLPRPRPPWAPTAIDMAAINGQQGANPGMGGALIGNGQMAPGIAPQGPPPAGISPTKWRGDNPSGGGMTPAQAPITQGTDGYTYQNGKVVGLTDWAQRGRQQGLGPDGQYAAANLAGQLKAQIRGDQARAAGQTTAVDKLRAQGMSPSDAYAVANSQAQQTAQAKAKSAPKTSSSKNNNGSWATGETSGSPFW